MSEDEVSFGEMFEALDEIRLVSSRVSVKSTEWYEKELAQQVTDLARVMSDVLSALRGHLACHDCDEDEEQEGG